MPHISVEIDLSTAFVGSIILLIIAAPLALWVSGLLKDLRFAEDHAEQTDHRFNQVKTVLETIRDMGPTGLDPLPPCRFCGQGPGHWSDPTDETCPAVVARDAIFRLNRPED